MSAKGQTRAVPAPGPLIPLRADIAASVGHVRHVPTAGMALLGGSVGAEIPGRISSARLAMPGVGVL